MPVAVTVKLAGWPSVTVAAEGWPVMVGATALALTVRVAALLVAEPALLVTTTVNWAPESERTVAGVV